MQFKNKSNMKVYNIIFTGSIVFNKYIKYLFTNI